MKRAVAFPVFLALALFACAEPDRITAPTSLRASQSPNSSSYVVVLSKGANPHAVASSHGVTPSHVYTHALTGFSAVLSEQAVDALERNPSVEYVELAGVRRVSDTQLNPVWGLDRIDQHALPRDGSYTYPAGAGAGVDVIIIDSGIRCTHVEFGCARMGEGASFVADTFGLGDPLGHGTHVAGTVGGFTYGVAKAVTLHADRIFDETGSAEDPVVLAGIDWAAAYHQAHPNSPAVANMSFGGPWSQAINDAVDALAASGVVPVIAAGNGAADACTQSPASAPSAITVGATDSLDTKAYFSNWGPCLTLWAPGVNIYSAYNSNDIVRAMLSGTSMATPHVSGTAALYLASHPFASPADVKAALIASSTKDVVLRGDVLGSPNRLVYVEGGTASAPPPPPPPPAAVVASFSVSCSRMTCAFDASASHADTGIYSYEWKYGDGAQGSGVQSSHTYEKPGAKTVMLIVTALDGAQAYATQTAKPSKR